MISYTELLDLGDLEILPIDVERTVLAMPLSNSLTAKRNLTLGELADTRCA